MQNFDRIYYLYQISLDQIRLVWDIYWDLCGTKKGLICKSIIEIFKTSLILQMNCIGWNHNGSSRRNSGTIAGVSVL